MQLTSILQTTAANWANLTAKMSIDWMKRDFWVYYYAQLADTVMYISKDIFICIIREQSIDEGESTWRQYKGCHNTINDISGQILWLHIVDTPMAKWVSMERQQFLVLHHLQSAWRLVETIPKCGICLLYRQESESHATCTILKFSVNRASTIFGLVCRVIQKRYGRSYKYN